MPSTNTTPTRLSFVAALAVATLCGSLFADPPLQAAELELDAVSTRLERLVAEEDLEGAGLVLFRNGAEIYEHTLGSYTADTLLPLASATKWLTVATVMTLVDEGLLHLDDPLGSVLTGFDGDRASITLRQALSCSSGFPSRVPDIGDERPSVRAFVESFAGVELREPPGTKLRYGGTGFEIAGAMAEAVTGQGWNEIFEQRIAGPLGMRRTLYGRFSPTGPAGGGRARTEPEHTTSPWLGGSAFSTLREYGTFVRMLANGGLHQGQRVLSRWAVEEMFADQIGDVEIAYSPYGDRPVRYGLGTWILRRGDDGEGLQASDQGAFGASPWIELDDGVAGFLLVQDRLRDVARAVSEIQELVRQAVREAAPSAIPSTGSFFGDSAGRAFETRIPLRDGKSLAADVYLPAGDGVYPTVLIQTPYDKQGMRPWFEGEGRWGEESLFTRRDFAFVVVDWRGRFASADAASPGARPGGSEDGFDAVEWIATQSWSNGRVGTWGPSALGGAQYRTAVARPPHLVCSVPVVMPLNLTHAIYFPGGVLWEEFVRTLSRLGWPLYDQLTARPTYDEFWQTVERTNGMQPEDIEVPMLLVGGWYDIYVDSVIETFDLLRRRGGLDTRRGSRLVIGPWLHRTDQLRNGELEFPAAVGAGIRQAGSFLDACLRGVGRNAEAARARITYFQTGSDEWRTSERWPPGEGGALRLFLHGDGTLSAVASPAGEEPTVLRYDPSDPVPTRGGHVLSPTLTAGPVDLSTTIERRDDVLVFSGEPLTEAVEVAGRARVVLAVSSDRRDTDVAVWLTDVDPTGRSILLTEGIQRMRYRNGPSGEELMEPGKVYRVEVAMTNLAHTFLPRHRIRLLISSSNHPKYARNLNDGGPQYREGDGLAATNRIHHDAGSGSALVLELD